jgi:zeta-carotene desaturase
VNLWFDRPVLDVPMLGMLGTTMDWAFDRCVLHHRKNAGPPYLVTLVASAADALSEQSRDVLATEALNDLERVCSRAARARLLRSRVVRQPLATSSLPPGITPPHHHTSLPGLFLSGDWTDTGLPATVESAVLSGHRAAEAVRAHLEGTADPV